MTQETQALTTYRATVPAMPDMPSTTSEDVEKALTIGDIGKMPAELRMKYYLAVCASAGLNPLTRPLTPFKGQDGQMFLYANAQCTEQLRAKHRLSVRTVSRERIDGMYIVTVEGRLPDGRTEEAQGIVEIANLKGVALANALMKAETKAKRRLTLAMCGLGFALAEDAPRSEEEARIDWQTGEILEASVQVRPIETKSLDAHIDDAFPTTPAPMAPTRLDLTAQIEAVVAAHHGDIEALYLWAERQYGKPRVQFTTDDLTGLLATVRERAKTKTAQKAPSSPVGETSTPDENIHTPHGHALPGDIDEWQKEEREEGESQGTDDDGQLTL